MSVAACGGGAAGDSPDPTSASEAPESATEIPEMTGPTELETSSPTAREPAATGTATLTIGDLTAEFSGLTCYYGEEAAAANNDDKATFGAVVQDGDAALVVLIRDTGIEIFEVVYVKGDGERWHMGLTDTENQISHVYSVENGVITVENGEFDQVIDQAETGVTEAGSLQASCG
jgi:hypothetical protein